MGPASFSTIAQSGRPNNLQPIVHYPPLPSSREKIIVGKVINRFKGKFGLKNLESLDATTFHQAMRPTIIIAQCFAMFPVRGVLGSSASALRFSWLSARVLYSAILVVGIGIMMALGLLRVSKIGVDFFNLLIVMFYAVGTLSLIQFMIMARHWPALARHWARVEAEMGPSPGRPLGRAINRHTAIVLSLALLEHSMSIASGLVHARLCMKEVNMVKAYFLNTFVQVFRYTEYTHWKAIVIEYINLVSTFAWNFMDLFILLVSLALTHRFQQINKRLNASRGLSMPDGFWRHQREEYLRLTNLVSAVDNVITRLTVLSFVNNLYFICAQLLYSLSRPSANATQAAYFWLSFLFLVGRTLSVSLYASRINEESRKPLGALRMTPSRGYAEDNEVRRFMEYISNEQIGFTGLKFFTITRGIILTIVGTIITYELVLVQFDKDTFTTTSECQ